MQNQNGSMTRNERALDYCELALFELYYAIQKMNYAVIENKEIDELHYLAFKQLEEAEKTLGEVVLKLRGEVDGN